MLDAFLKRIRSTPPAASAAEVGDALVAARARHAELLATRGAALLDGNDGHEAQITATAAEIARLEAIADELSRRAEAAASAARTQAIADMLAEAETAAAAAAAAIQRGYEGHARAIARLLEAEREADALVVSVMKAFEAAPVEERPPVTALPPLVRQRVREGASAFGPIGDDVRLPPLRTSPAVSSAEPPLWPVPGR